MNNNVNKSNIKVKSTFSHFRIRLIFSKYTFMHFYLHLKLLNTNKHVIHDQLLTLEKYIYAFNFSE